MTTLAYTLPGVGEKTFIVGYVHAYLRADFQTSAAILQDMTPDEIARANRLLRRFL